MMTQSQLPISSGHRLRAGRVSASSIQGFTVGCQAMREEVPEHGALVRVDAPATHHVIYAVIEDIQIGDDREIGLAGSLAASGEDLPVEVMLDQARNLPVPIVVRCRSLAWGLATTLPSWRLPAQPPGLLEWLYVCSDEEIKAITAGRGFRGALINLAQERQNHALVIAMIGNAVTARPALERPEFLVIVTRALAGSGLMISSGLGTMGLIQRISSAAPSWLE